MLKLVLITTLFTLSYVVAQERPIWYRWEPLLANPTFVDQLYQCVRYNGVCTKDQTAIRDVLQEHVCDNCRNCCSFRRNLVEEVRKKFRELDEQNLTNEAEPVDIGDMIECP